MSDVAVVGRFAGSTALGAVGSTSISCHAVHRLFDRPEQRRQRAGRAAFTAPSSRRAMSRRPSIRHSSSALLRVSSCCLSACWASPARAGTAQHQAGPDCTVRSCTCAFTFWACRPWRCITSATRCSAPSVTPKSRCVYLSIAGALNIVLNLFFVIVCQHERGWAWRMASVISQYLSAGLMVLRALYRSARIAMALRPARYAVWTWSMSQAHPAAWACLPGFQNGSFCHGQPVHPGGRQLL